MMSDEDTDADDFELPKSPAASRRVTNRKDRPIGLSPVFEHASPKFDLRYHVERSGSMSTVQTVKPNRRARLAEKLAEVFEIAGIIEVIAGGYHIYLSDTTLLTTVSSEMPCWLMRSVCACAFDIIMRYWIQYVPVLQGYIYLTNSYLCFFAHMPSREVSFTRIACQPRNNHFSRIKYLSLGRYIRRPSGQNAGLNTGLF